MNQAPSMPTPQRNSHRFLMLDLMRGIAAISVLVYHDDAFLGTKLLPNAYLAVDLFFLLSGFVIAHNYDSKIASGMSFADFMVQRLIRLYPCLLITLMLGVVIFCLRMGREAGFLDGWRVLGAAGLNALFLPAVTTPYGIGSYFPFNGAAWSLTFELLANILYWCTFRYLNGLRLGMLILVAAAGTTIAVCLVGTVDVGMRTSDFWWGVPRVCLSFFIGVALRRHFYDRMPTNLTKSAAPLVLLWLLLAFCVSALTSPALIPAAELVIVGLLFPLLLWIVGGATPGARTAVVCKWTGDASYPVYLLQTPLMGVFAAIPQILWGMKASNFTPWIGMTHIAGTIILALLIDRYFELPLRRLLKGRWQRFRTSAASARLASVEIR